MTMMDRDWTPGDDPVRDGAADENADYSWGGTIKPHEKWAEMPPAGEPIERPILPHHDGCRCDEADKAKLHVEQCPWSNPEPVEWPGPVDSTDLNNGETFLTIEQEQRASALHQARIVLERRGGSGFTGNGPLPTSTPPTCTDLLRVANFILTGEK